MMTKKQDVDKLYKKCKPFTIDGPNVARWAEHLSKVSIILEGNEYEEYLEQ